MRRHTENPNERNSFIFKFTTLACQDGAYYVSNDLDTAKKILFVDNVESITDIKRWDFEVTNLYNFISTDGHHYSNIDDVLDNHAESEVWKTFIKDIKERIDKEYRSLNGTMISLDPTMIADEDRCGCYFDIFGDEVDYDATYKITHGMPHTVTYKPHYNQIDDRYNGIVKNIDMYSLVKANGDYVYNEREKK